MNTVLYCSVTVHLIYIQIQANWPACLYHSYKLNTWFYNSAVFRQPAKLPVLSCQTLGNCICTPELWSPQQQAPQEAAQPVLRISREPHKPPSSARCLFLYQHDEKPPQKSASSFLNDEQTQIQNYHQRQLISDVLHKSTIKIHYHK